MINPAPHILPPLLSNTLPEFENTFQTDPRHVPKRALRCSVVLFTETTLDYLH